MLSIRRVIGPVSPRPTPLYFVRLIPDLLPKLFRLGLVSLSFRRIESAKTPRHLTRDIVHLPHVLELLPGMLSSLVIPKQREGLKSAEIYVYRPRFLPTWAGGIPRGREPRRPAGVRGPPGLHGGSEVLQLPVDKLLVARELEFHLPRGRLAAGPLCIDLLELIPGLVSKLFGACCVHCLLRLSEGGPLPRHFRLDVLELLVRKFRLHHAVEEQAGGLRQLGRVRRGPRWVAGGIHRGAGYQAPPGGVAIFTVFVVVFVFVIRLFLG